MSDGIHCTVVLRTVPYCVYVICYTVSTYTHFITNNTTRVESSHVGVISIVIIRNGQLRDQERARWIHKPIDKFSVYSEIRRDRTRFPDAELIP